MTLLSKISNTTSMFAKRLNEDYETWMMAECSAESRSRNGCPDGSGSKDLSTYASILALRSLPDRHAYLYLGLKMGLSIHFLCHFSGHPVRCSSDVH